MLSPQPMSADQAGYYLNLAREDYYLEGGEPPGLWHGEGARRLDLGAQVQADELYNLFDGLSPDGKHSLVKFQKKAESAAHLPGWDLTFSAPKSLSVIWSQATPETRARISELNLEAVRIALNYLEERYGHVRLGQGGKQAAKAGLIFALFEHSTSRALDAQLHIHALLMNAAITPSGKTGTLNAKRIFQAKMALGAIYRQALATLVMTDLGIKTHPVKTWWEADDVSETLIKVSSKRRQEIEKVIEKVGTNTAKVAQMAAIETREAKQDVSRHNLFEGVWREDGLACGWSTPQAEATLGQYKQKRTVNAELKAVTTKAITSVEEKSAHFNEEMFHRALFESAQTSAIPTDVLLEHARTYLATSPDIVRLGARKKDVRYASRAMFELEAQMLQNADALAIRRKHVVEPSAAVQRLAKTPELNAEQMKAVMHLLDTSGDLAVLSGVPGSGKSTLLKAAREEWEKAGYRVIGVAVNSEAAQSLEKSSGIKSDTLAKLLHDVKVHGNPQDARGPIESLAKTHGPNILEPIEKLVDKFGPNIMQIVDPIVTKWGDKVLEPLVKLSEQYSIDPLQRLKELNKKHGPNVLQAFHSLAHYVTENLPHFGKEPPPMDRKSVVVLDEAGSLNTAMGAEFMKACAGYGVKLVLVGGKGQLPAIGPGGGFEELISRHPGVELVKNSRQKSDWMKEAVKDIEQGHPEAALRDFVKREALKLFDSRDDAKKALIDRWSADGRGVEDKRILTGTREDASDLNRMAQDKRLESKEIGGKPLKHRDENFYEGDLISFQAPARKLGVSNGERGEVEGINSRRGQLVIRLVSGSKVTVKLDDYPDVGLGYAQTTHSVQGGTYKEGYVLYDSAMESKEMFRVQVSRFEHQVSVYATHAEAGDDLREMRRQVSRSQEKELAHAVAKSPEPSRSIRR